MDAKCSVINGSHCTTLLRVLTVKSFSTAFFLSGPLAQSIRCLTADPEVASLIPGQSHTFVEINHEIISKAILLLPLIPEGLLSVTSESMCRKYWLTA